MCWASSLTSYKEAYLISCCDLPFIIGDCYHIETQHNDLDMTAWNELEMFNLQHILTHYNLIVTKNNRILSHKS